MTKKRLFLKLIHTINTPIINTILSFLKKPIVITDVDKSENPKSV